MSQVFVNAAVRGVIERVREGVDRVAEITRRVLWPVLARGTTQAEVLRVLRRAVRLQRTVAIKIFGIVVEIEPHRIFQQLDASYLIESYQVAGPGGGVWGAAAAKSRAGIVPPAPNDCFPLQPKIQGRTQGWRHVPMERIEAIELLDRKFKARPGYNPNSTRRMGRTEVQVRDAPAPAPSGGAQSSAAPESAIERRRRLVASLHFDVAQERAARRQQAG